VQRRVRQRTWMLELGCLDNENSWLTNPGYQHAQFIRAENWWATMNQPAWRAAQKRRWDSKKPGIWQKYEKLTELANEQG